MKRILSLLLSCILFLSSLALADQNTSFVGEWIETEGYGTLTIRLDGTAEMVYYDGTAVETTWGLTDDGYRFGDGMWYNSPMELLDENTLSVSDGWMIFAREGFLPTTDEALLLGAEPIGEEGAPFLGAWELIRLVIEGEEMDPALFGMTMTITFQDNGLVITDDGMEPYTTTWFASYGTAVVEGDVLYLDENDQLIFNDADGAMVFARIPTAGADPEQPVEAETENPLSEEEQLLALLELLSLISEVNYDNLAEQHQPFVGDWYLCYIDIGSLTGDLRSLGITGTLTLYEDYTGEFSSVFAYEYTSWQADDDGTIRIGGTAPMSLIGDAEDEAGCFLQCGTESTGYAIFHKDENAVWTPAETAVTAGALLTDVKYVCTSYTTSGITLDAATLGAEYSVTFGEDDTVSFTLAGFNVPVLPYAVSDGQYVIDYYGTPFSCIPTDTGFDMDYYGSMMMHFVPAE